MSIQAAESVGIGHPDKIADVIADKLLEDLLQKDLTAQCAVEVLAANNLIVVAGELSSFYSDSLNVEEIVFHVLKKLGYQPENFQVISSLKGQSLDIRNTSVKSSRGIVSGDQSIVVGYANNETSKYMPLAFEVAAAIMRRMENCIDAGIIVGARYDAKSLVVLDGKEVKEIILSVQHVENIDLVQFRRLIYAEVIQQVVDKYDLKISEEVVFINSSEKFVIGGLDADTGITNRKLMVDSYGTIARHGGGGYSGKDLTKVDRLGAYYARWICKNLVASGLCREVELELVFHYGSSEPFMFFRKVDSDYSVEKLIQCIKSVFSFSFEEIYKLFNCAGIRYSELAGHGHFGIDGLPWEELNKVDEIRNIWNGIGS